MKKADWIRRTLLRGYPQDSNFRNIVENMTDEELLEKKEEHDKFRVREHVAVGVFAMLVLSLIPTYGQVPAVRNTHGYMERAVGTTAACGIAIAVSGNKEKAAEIGLPILVGGNILARKLLRRHHKLSEVIQIVSPLGCFMPYSESHQYQAANRPNFPVNRFPVPPNQGGGTYVPPGSGGSGSGNGGSGGSAGGGNTGNGSNGGSGSGNGGSGGGTTGGGGSGGNGGGGNNPPPVGPCTVRGGTDCGKGNGGFNNGTPSGPPFTPPGKGGNPGDGKKN